MHALFFLPTYKFYAAEFLRPFGSKRTKFERGNSAEPKALFCHFKTMCYFCHKSHTVCLTSVVTKKQLIVTVDDSVNVANVTRAIKMLRGVVDIRSAETKKKPTLCNPETGEHLNEKTMKVIEDVRNGKEQMVSYSSLEDFEKAMRSL